MKKLLSILSGLGIAPCCLQVLVSYSVASLFCFPGEIISLKSSGQVICGKTLGEMLSKKSGFELEFFFLSPKYRPEKQLFGQSNVWGQRHRGAHRLPLRADLVSDHPGYLPRSVHLIRLPHWGGLPGLQRDVLHALFQNPRTKTSGEKFRRVFNKLK